VSIVHYRRDGLKRHWLSLWGGVELNLQFGKLRWLWANIEWGEGYCGGVKFSAGVWWGVWFTIGIPAGLTRRLGRFWPRNTRMVGIAYNYGRLRIELFTSPWAGGFSRTSQRRWWTPFWSRNELTLFNTKWIVGESDHTVRIVAPPVAVVAPLDGTTYSLLVTRWRRTTKNRIRTHTSEYWEIDVPKGAAIPQFAGKGENSWDCDDDAIYSMSAPYPEYPTAERARWAYVMAVMRNRERYGMPRSLSRRA